MNVVNLSLLWFSFFFSNESRFGFFSFLVFFSIVITNSIIIDNNYIYYYWWIFPLLVDFPPMASNKAY